MEKAELEKMFGVKLYLELENYKRRMLKKSQEEIFAKAYQINIIVSIYEEMLDMSQEMKEEALKTLLAFPSLLVFLYSRWTKCEDSAEDELRSCLKIAVAQINSTYDKVTQGADAA